MQPSTNDEPLPLVAAIEAMSDANLLRHINARHPECWRGTAPLIPLNDLFQLSARHHWQTLHARLHAEGDETHLHE